MWISYSDSEVNRFHPICERALNYALRLIGKDDQYRVLHHQYTGALEMDYVVQNIATGKYLCVVEVKRTPADVHSARYQFQAMSYVQMNAGQSEKPFYILTNLEYAFSFRYDAGRPRVFQQMLKPGLSHIGSFDIDDEEIFVEKLARYFSERLTDYTNNSYDYLVTLEEFASHMEHIKDEPKRWKTHLAALLYEYIRGAFTFINRNELRDIRLFRNDVERICDEAARVNFKDIFNYSDESFERTVDIENDTLIDLYDFGNQNINGDSVAGILHSIVSAGHEHDGEVPTDLELARIVAELAKYSSGDLEPTDLVCDPAAGSGNLISAAIPTYNLLPKEYALQQALSGTEYHGFKVVEGRSNRKYTDESAVADAVIAAGFDPYEQKLLGITAMTTVLGKKKFDEILGDFTYKPQGKPTLVSESDKRPAINNSNAALAAEDFNEN